LSTPVFSHGITLQSGSSLNLNGGRIDMGCGDLDVQGSASLSTGAIRAGRHVTLNGGNLVLGSGTITLSGDWINSGSFIPGTGTVNIVDGCGVSESLMAGDSAFYRFSATTGSGKLLSIAAASTQTFSRYLELRGTEPNRLAIRSSAAGSTAFFSLASSGSQNISAVDVSDNDASGGQVLVPREPEAADSIDAGGNSNWFISLIAEAIPVDTLPTPALLALALLLAGLAALNRPGTLLENRRS
jgi:hypothetical protein